MIFYYNSHLYKSIVFADGIFTKELPSIVSTSNIDSFTKKQLELYRLTENESILFLKSLDSQYFQNFQKALYTRDAETISIAMTKVIQDLIPFINQKLAIQGLSIDKIAKNLKKDANGNILNAEGQMKAICAIWVVGLLVVAVIVLVIVAVGDTPAYKINNALTLDTISIQIAEHI